MGKLGATLLHAWNIFSNQGTEGSYSRYSSGVASSHRQDRQSMRPGNERILVAAIYTRIAIDVASVDLRHVRLDEDERYLETIKSGLHECLNVEANIDQSGRAMLQDAVYTMLDHGDVALVPIKTDLNPNVTGGYDIRDMRVGRISDYLPEHVRVEVYNDRVGSRQQVVVPKRSVGIVENPLYAVMNEPNSNLQRIQRKLAEIDAVESQVASGKMDIIIQVPYSTRTDDQRIRAEQRRKDIEFQLKDSQYGIAYADSMEKIIQLNRPVENNLLKTFEYLMNMLYGQLGITASVMDGTADEATMLNYYNRTIEPILGAFAGEIKRKFLTKTARTQGQSIEYYRDAFKLVTMKDLAEIADKFIRNEVASGNDMRQAVGWRPRSDPKANELRNPNMPDPNPGLVPEEAVEDVDVEGGTDPLDDIDTTIAEMEKLLEGVG